MPDHDCLPGVRCRLTTGCVWAHNHEPPCLVEEPKPCSVCRTWPWEPCNMEKHAAPKAPPIVVLLDPVQLDLLIEALDSHLSDMNYRNDGHVMDPGTDNPEKLGEMVESQELIDKLEALRPRPVTDLDDGDLSSGGGGNFSWKYRGKGYVHASALGEPFCLCKASAAVATHGDFSGKPETVLAPGSDPAHVTCPACKHMLGIEPCGQHPVGG